MLYLSGLLGNAMKKIEGIEDDMLLYLYKEVLIYWENNSTVSFGIKHGGFKKFVARKEIAVEWAKTLKQINVNDHPSKDWKQYTVCYVDKSSQPASLLCHLRNSVAHGLMSKKKIKNRWFYCFEDYGRDNTMAMATSVRHV